MDKLRRTFTGSASGALAALLMVGAIAFGATVVRPMTADRHTGATTAPADGTSSAAGQDGADASGPGDVADDGAAPGSETAGGDQQGTVATAPGCQDEQGNPIPCDGVTPHDPNAQPDPPADEPKDEPPSQPPSEPPSAPPSHDPAPSTDLTLAAVFNAEMGKIVVEWSAYGGDFQKYKLVRSTDGAATWPLGPGDQLVDVVPAGSDRRFVDGDAPCNTEFHYRAFAVVHTDTGYTVLASSNVGAATRACTEPTPVEPKAMGLDAAQTADGVQLSWTGCGSDGFAAYKVVRSATNPNPMYPLNDGTQLLVYFHDQGTVQYTDSSVVSGQTWTYRVLCMGQNADGWFVIGLTDAKTVTVS